MKTRDSDLFHAVIQITCGVLLLMPPPKWYWNVIGTACIAGGLVYAGRWLLGGRK